MTGHAGDTQLRDIAKAINGLTEFLRLERKRVPGRILSEADRLECLFFDGFDPDVLQLSGLLAGDVKES